MTDRLIPTTYANLQTAAAAAAHGDRLVIEGAHPAGGISLNLEALNNIEIINTSGAPQTANITVGAMKAGAGTIVTPGAGLRLVFGAGTNCEVSAGKSLTCAPGVTFAFGGANGFTGNPTGGTLALNGAHLEGIAGAAGTVFFGDTPGLTSTMTGGTVTTGRSLVYTSGGAGASLTLRRVVCTGLYNALDFAGGSYALTARKCVMSASNKGVLASSAGGTPVVSIKGCVLDAPAATDKTVGTPGGTWTWADNWGATIDAWGTWDYNGYTTLAAGVGGAHDVVTAAPLFVGGGDWHTQTGSPLRNAGTATGETLDLDGLPCPSGSAEDIGPYEFQYVDCGVASVTASDSLTMTVTFAASGGGSQSPLEASAETPTNWVLTHAGDATYDVLTAERQSAYVYRLRTTHRSTPGATITVDASAIATTAGGLCNTPGTGACTAVSDPVTQATPEFPQTFGPCDLVGEDLP